MPYTSTFDCLFCHTSVTKKVSTKDPKFCSSKCQQLSQQQQLTEEWLQTGIAQPASLSHKSNYIKRYLATAQQHQCAICANPNAWHGHELVFILDHIDGNSSNNSRTNLRLVCPNCDSQLPTFKGRNKGNGRHLRRQRYADGLSH